MIIDYLYNIRNIISNSPNDNKKISNVIISNDILIDFLRGGNIAEKYQHGGTGDVVQKARALNTSLKEMLDSMTGEGEGVKTHEKMIEIATVAIELIKFLGELIDEQKSSNLGVVQKQIAELVTSLSQYINIEKYP